MTLLVRSESCDCSGCHGHYANFSSTQGISACETHCDNDNGCIFALYNRPAARCFFYHQAPPFYRFHKGHEAYTCYDKRSTQTPTFAPTIPSPAPTPTPSFSPSPQPTPLPSMYPTRPPTPIPSFSPTPFPSPAPTPEPSPVPSPW